jgi:hypothetical protein
MRKLASSRLPFAKLLEDQAEDLTRGFRSLAISNTASSNPFRRRVAEQSTGHNLFLAQGNPMQSSSIEPPTELNPFHTQTSSSHASHARPPGRRPNTSMGHSRIHRTHGDRPDTRAVSGFLTPERLTNLDYMTQGHVESRTRWSQAPAIPRSQAHQNAEIPPRPQSVLEGSSSRHSGSSARSGSNMQGMKVISQRYWRSFFKCGRVRVSE